MKSSATLALAVVALFGSSGASAQYLWQAAEAAKAPTKGAAKPASPAAAVTAPAQGAGLTAFIDPVTGELRAPDPEEMRALNAQAQATQLSRGLFTPSFISGPGGAVGMILDSSFESFILARKLSDGTIDIACVPGAKEAAAALSASIRPAGMVQKKVVPDEK